MVRRRTWLAGLLLYGLGAGADFAYHLIEDPRSSHRAVEFSAVPVAFSGALFWPIDVITVRLLAT